MVLTQIIKIFAFQVLEGNSCRKFAYLEFHLS